MLGKGKVEVNVKFILGEATSELDGVACQRQATDILPLGKTRYPLYVQEAGWAPGPDWTCAKNLAPTGQHVASRYTDCANRAFKLTRP
jgi:hypothetical protein